MIINKLLLGTNYAGYIAGSGDGIVTVASSPSARDIVLLDASSLATIAHTASLDSGHYIFTNLKTDGEYLVMVRDYNRQYEPFVWDYVSPADDLTATEQKTLWQSWQMI